MTYLKDYSSKEWLTQFKDIIFQMAALSIMTNGIYYAHSTVNFACFSLLKGKSNYTTTTKTSVVTTYHCLNDFHSPGTRINALYTLMYLFYSYNYIPILQKKKETNAEKLIRLQN